MAHNVSQINVIFENDTIIFSNKVSPASVKDIQLYCPGNTSTGYLNLITSSHQVNTDIDLSSELEMDIFYKDLAKAKEEPAILKFTNPYADRFIPVLTIPSFPKSLADLCSPSSLQMDYPTLMKECEVILSTLQVIHPYLYIPSMFLP